PGVIGGIRLLDVLVDLARLRDPVVGRDLGLGVVEPGLRPGRGTGHDVDDDDVGRHVPPDAEVRGGGALPLDIQRVITHGSARTTSPRGPQPSALLASTRSRGVQALGGAASMIACASAMTLRSASSRTTAPSGSVRFMLTSCPLGKPERTGTPRGSSASASTWLCASA